MTATRPNNDGRPKSRQKGGGDDEPGRRASAWWKPLQVKGYNVQLHGDPTKLNKREATSRGNTVFIRCADKGGSDGGWLIGDVVSGVMTHFHALTDFHGQ